MQCLWIETGEYVVLNSTNHKRTPFAVTQSKPWSLDSNPSLAITHNFYNCDSSHWTFRKYVRLIIQVQRSKLFESPWSLLTISITFVASNADKNMIMKCTATAKTGSCNNSILNCLWFCYTSYIFATVQHSSKYSLCSKYLLGLPLYRLNEFLKFKMVKNIYFWKNNRPKERKNINKIKKKLKLTEKQSLWIQTFHIRLEFVE